MVKFLGIPLPFLKSSVPVSSGTANDSTPVVFDSPLIGAGVENRTVTLDDMHPYGYAGQQLISAFQSSIYDGEKFYGGFGVTQLQQIDYWTLRKRSAQLFNENLYARGLIRRLITNEINTGLTPECCPDEKILGLPEDSLNDWTESVENRFGIWSKDGVLCDYLQAKTFGAIQRAARAEALISGDVLVVLRQSQRTRLPMVQLINGDKVQTPFISPSDLKAGNTINNGVELDSAGRQVAYWVKQSNGEVKRLPAWGEKSGRKLAWLVYGTDKRLDDVRGQPLLALIMQAVKELDRYKDSAQRKAVVNSILAMFIKKTEDKLSSMPISGGAKRRDSVTVTDPDGKPRSFNIANHVPGVVMEELQHGEEPVGFHSQGTDVDFGKFEEVIVASLAWANEIPPEILTLAFSNNYSASQAAINEFKIYLNKVWSDWGETFCTPIYIDFMISETLLNKIDAPGFLDSWQDASKYDIFGAWTSVDWYGSIKPSTDMLKQARGSQLLVSEGWSTNAREARITTGTKFSKNIKRLKRENELKAAAARPIAEFNKEFGLGPTDPNNKISGVSGLDMMALVDKLEEINA